MTEYLNVKVHWVKIYLKTVIEEEESDLLSSVTGVLA